MFLQSIASSQTSRTSSLRLSTAPPILTPTCLTPTPSSSHPLLPLSIPSPSSQPSRQPDHPITVVLKTLSTASTGTDSFNATNSAFGPDNGLRCGINSCDRLVEFGASYCDNAYARPSNLRHSLKPSSYYKGLYIFFYDSRCMINERPSATLMRWVLIFSFFRTAREAHMATRMADEDPRQAGELLQTDHWVISDGRISGGLAVGSY
ncbi:hypothetical protein PGTUg99_003394 [Puccinia graminis f. sp. tritici]|uniref:Uncharacterized protein n=1 Tax=Puccinia graminis f. sp. tritici TaxID=56615 RepID=A0A5B0S399_PUCGR|nr:hypothetical protein PGTUg99_003394 [Puccinia graminis f. sp. tritici]